MEKTKLKDNSGFKGSFVVRKHKAGDIKFHRDDQGRAIADVASLKAAMSNPLFESPRIHNLIVSSTGGYGRNLVMRKLMGDNTYGIEIDSAKIGTGSTAPVDGDTDLETPVLTITPVALFELTAHDTLLISWFIPSEDLANGTYNEFSQHIGGRLFSRAIISPAHTKGTNEDSTIEYEVSLS